MIAVLQLSFAGQITYAALHDNGKWTCVDPELKIALNTLCDPNEEKGPEFGAYGVAQVQRAIDKWNGKILWRKQGDKVERVY